MVIFYLRKIENGSPYEFNPFINYCIIGGFLLLKSIPKYKNPLELDITKLKITVLLTIYKVSNFKIGIIVVTGEDV